MRAVNSSKPTSGFARVEFEKRTWPVAVFGDQRCKWGIGDVQRRCNHYTQALAILDQSECIGVLPTSLLELSPYSVRLISGEPPIAMPVRPLGIIWHQRRDNDPAHRWLRATIVSLFAKPSGTAPDRWASGRSDGGA